jgi:histidinol-phosphate aminotransferase
LERIPYLTPYPSQTNFILCRVRDRDPQTLRAALEQQGILLRYYDKPGMDDLIRITVGTPEQTDKLIAALQRWNVQTF